MKTNKMQSKPGFFPASFFTALLFGGCLFGGNSSDSGPQGALIVSQSYVLAGNSLLVSSIDTSYYCVGDSLAIDEYPYTDTLKFELLGNVFNGLGSFPDSLPSGAVVQTVTAFQRVGSGSGIQGLWKEGVVSYRVLSGVMSADEKKNYDGDVETVNKILSFGTAEINITANKFSRYQNVRMAEYFIARWNGLTYPDSLQYLADSATYTISLKALNQFTAELKGLKTGEIVRYTRQNNNDRVYTSSDSSHAESHYYAHQKPQTCADLMSNSFPPDWYSDFRLSNQKTSAIPLHPTPLPKAARGNSRGHRFPFFGTDWMSE